MELGNVAQWVGAIATFSAVIVALFKESILRRWRRPILDIEITLEPADCHLTQARSGHVVADCYYFRFWIKNTGASRAEQVQVFASKLSRKTGWNTPTREEFPTDEFRLVP